MRPIIFEDDLSQLLDQFEPSMLFDGSTVDELERWQDRFRSTVVGLLGLYPERSDLSLEFLTETDCGDHVRHRIRYQTELDVFVPAYLLVPKEVQNQVPGLLCLHGHSQFGKDGVAGIDNSPERKEEIVTKGYNFGQKFAQQGYVTLMPDLRGFGERRPNYPNPRVDYCMRNYLCATLMGTTVVALHLCDLQAALDVLQSLDYIDSEMLGCAGISLGGRMAMMISAFDSRVKIAVPSGCLSMYQERYQALKKCGAQLIPGLLQYGDTPEIFSLIAPRPMVIEWGLEDRLAPHEWAERALVRVRKAYGAAGASDQLFVDQFNGGHQFNMKVASDVLNKWRNGGL